MNPSKPFLTAAVLFGLAGAGPAMAASSASSAASDSITTSVGSVTGSFGTSSDSSSKTATAATGDYKIIALGMAPDRQGVARVKLQALADERGADRGKDGEFFLYLPQAVVEQARLAEGGIVTARQRPYGTEFAYGTAGTAGAAGAAGTQRQAFFLVLTDDWYRELQTTPVQL